MEFAKKCLLICSVYPYPVDTGKKVVLSGFLEYFKRGYSKENLHCIVVSANEISKNILNHDGFCTWHVVYKPNIFEQLYNLTWFVLIRRKKTIQEAMLYSKKTDKQMKAIIGEVQPGVIIIDTIRASQYFEKDNESDCKRILYMDDLFSVRYEKMLNIMSKYPDIDFDALGNFAKFVPLVLRFLVKINYLQKLVLAFEKKIIAKRESECVKWFDCNLLINKQETRLLKQRTASLKIMSIRPLLINTEAKINRQRDYHGEPTFIFLGALNVPQNDVAIVYFIDTQMELILKKIPDVKIRVIGRGASQQLLALVNRYKRNISLEGYVQDLTEVFQHSCAMVIPLLFGSGVKLKTLEAFAKGLPVIATDFGVEGIDITSGIHCIVENNLKEYPDKMASLINTEANQQISQNAYEFYLANYSENVVINQYHQIFNSR